MAMEWRFKRLTRNDTLQNASHLEFFHNEALHSTVDALAREDIQNRLDARAPNQPRVEVRYRFCGPAPFDRKKTWFKGLEHHLSSPQVAEELGKVPRIEPSLKWLVIEDFCTTGLEGDPGRFQDPPSDERPRNDFFWFVRNVGRSGKKGGDRGRWGLGKIVYPAASKIRAFFACTTRASDKFGLLIGRSVLAVHTVDSDQYDSEGYFGRFDDPAHEFFATPELDHAALASFSSDFSLSRNAGESGLSLVIPWPEEDITPDALIRSLIDHWFWIFLEDRLIVRVSCDTHGGETVLSKDTLEHIVEERMGSTQAGRQLLRKIAFARSVQDFEYDGPNHYQLLVCPDRAAPKWDSAESRFHTEEKLNEAREKYRCGQVLGFDVPVCVRRSDGSLDETASFEVYLQRTEEGDKAIESFLRDGLTISGQSYLREPGALAIVKADENALGTLLGDAENPAHTRWERGGKHFRGRYEFGPSVLSYVQRSAQHLCTLLSRTSEGMDRDLLVHLFSVAEPGIARNKIPKPKLGKEVPPVSPDPPDPQSFYLECRKLQGGFRVVPHEKAEGVPAGIRLRAAYEVAKGNPFKHHHPADFDFTKKNGLDLALKGLTIVESRPNVLILRVDAKDFELTATRFDPHRDLIVNVRPLHDLSESSGEASGQQQTGTEEEA